MNRNGEELKSLFGRRIFSVNSDSTSSNKPSRSTKALYIFSVGTNTEENSQGFVVGHCWYCDDTSHVIHDCPKLKELNFKKRSKFIRTNQRCKKCFCKKHKTKNCKRSNICNVKVPFITLCRTITTRHVVFHKQLITTNLQLIHSNQKMERVIVALVVPKQSPAVKLQMEFIFARFL